MQPEPLNPDEQNAIDQLFSYHAPEANQILRLAEVRATAKKLAECFIRNCPRSADRSAAMRLLREAVMTANASIVVPPVGNVL